MWVIIDWTDTQVIGPFNSYNNALIWLTANCKAHGKEWRGLDASELSIHKVLETDKDPTIRWDA